MCVTYALFSYNPGCDVPGYWDRLLLILLETSTTRSTTFRQPLKGPKGKFYCLFGAFLGLKNEL